MPAAAPSFDLLARPPRVLLANSYPFRRGEAVGPHWSESDLFLATTRGRGEVRVGPERFALESSMLLHVPWAAPVAYLADRRHPFMLIGVHLAYAPWSGPTPAEALRTHGRADPARRTMRETDRPLPYDQPFVLSCDRETTAIDLAADIAQAFADHDRPDRGLLLRALSLRFLIELRVLQRGESRLRPHPSAAAVRDVASWLELSFARPISRPEMAARAGMSETALAVAFRAATGKSPVSYLIDLRLGHAARMLRTSSMRVSEIAGRVGIPDVFHFSKLFKKRIGMPPLRYRQRLSRSGP
jgi:AraC-like DNA-binding protein